MNLVQNHIPSVPARAIRPLSNLVALDLSLNNITEIKTDDFSGKGRGREVRE